ncbi:MAG: MBOAT family protein [Acidimicrobiia bacterium]|nr:MBOAT family protein [Acidimicrobiia bacterium]
MLFPTVEFAIFFLVVLTANWLLLPHRGAWKVFMLAASYLFYGAWDWRFLGLIIASTVFNQAMATVIDRAPDPNARKRLVKMAVAGNLAALGWFKYYGFFVSSAVNLAGRLGIDLPLPLLRITLPVGISFFTFQALSYVIDVYRGSARPTAPLDFAVFLAFFPQLVAGPIVRSSEFLPQLKERKDPRNVEAVEAFGLIAGGLFKKVVVANTLAAAIVDGVFANPGAYSALEVLFAIYGYAVQIYADFSGYTDIAIGVALLMGFRFPQNFEHPYRAVSLQDFWRRWHMTLSRWLRDYLYIPLGGSRGTRAETYRNLLLTMVLGGLWHGAAWTFVVWGLLHGGGLAVERWMGERAEPRPQTPATVFARRVLTFHLVCLGWVFFRAESFALAGTMLSRLVHFGPAPAVTPTVLLLVAGGIAVHYVPRHLRLRARHQFGRLRPVAMAAALGAVLLLVDGLGPEGVAPFIYFQF